MESSGQGQTPGGGKKSEGFSKFVRRASKALKPSSKRGSMVSERGAVTEAGPSNTQSSKPATSALQVANPVAAPAATTEASTTPAPKPKTETPLRSRRAPSPHVEVVRSTPTTAAAHYKLQEEKARALFAKYNLSLEPGEWSTTKAATSSQWVEKQVRMRVHRVCHRCQNSFGTDKTCTHCAHTRCKKCPRIPEQAKGRKEKAMVTVVVDSDPKYQGIPRRAKPVPTMLSKGGQEMIRKAPTQRARRFCHKCSALFEGKATECTGCKHQRCPKCPREPAKTKKYPNGYPGDVEETFPLSERTLKKIRQRVRWECHGCNKTFIEHERICGECKHERCDNCRRYPPKKVKPEPHPDVVRGLEEKLARAALSPAA